MSVKVLVVDDDPKKLARIIGFLGEVGIERGSIDVGQNGVDARRHLADTAYDLLVLDVALPMRAEDAPDRRGGLKLLEELVERDAFKLPRSVVGLTAYEDLQFNVSMAVCFDRGFGHWTCTTHQTVDGLSG